MKSKISNEEIVRLYKEHGSIWKVAEIVGLCGQSIHERLQKIGKITKVRRLTDPEKEKIKEVYMSGIKRGDGKLKKLSLEIGRTIPFISRYARTLGLTSYNRIKKHRFVHDQDVNHALFPTYYQMIQRCENPTHKFYKDYGKRGISVCKRWRNSFMAFLNDMGEKPSKKHSLDRMDNDGNYEPSNCKWSTAHEQARNTRKYLNAKKQKK